ncbi:MAG: aldo/keto reductase [Hyphomicrobiales bacterium]|nr:aldo/keto reductase [Hyphomicrobiales bacterium]
MLTRPIPSSGEAMPVIGIGTYRTFDIGADKAALAERVKVLETLFAAGGRMIDSSPMYDTAEANVGRALAMMRKSDPDVRRKAFLATKVWTHGAQAGVREMQRSARLMGASGDRMMLDLMQIHNLVDWRTHMKTLRAWKEQGRVRYIGITHYTSSALDDLAAVIAAEKVDFVQFAYSIDVRDAERRFLPFCADKGVAAIINRPFGSGSLFGQAKGRALPDFAKELGIASWAQFFLKYILGHPAVTVAIPGTGKVAHARDNVAAGMGPLPGANERRRMVDFWERG